MLSTLNTGRVPGLTLKAWAFFDYAGVLKSGMNVSSITKGTAGQYDVNYTTAMINPTQIVVVNTVPGYSGTPGPSWTAFTTLTKAHLYLHNGNSLADATTYVAVYE
jgi:hypothetical protein